MNTSQKKAVLAMLISDNIHLNIKNTSSNTEGHCLVMREGSSQPDIASHKRIPCPPIFFVTHYCTANFYIINEDKYLSATPKYETMKM